MNTIYQVMQHGMKEGWTEDQLIKDLKKRFRRLNGISHIRESYRRLLAEAKSPLTRL